ncbi:hypothetical protein GIB67_011027, partial [Kingdonia uniflora]
MSLRCCRLSGGEEGDYGGFGKRRWRRMWRRIREGYDEGFDQVSQIQKLTKHVMNLFHTRDGTVDLQRQPVLVSKTGKWKACVFLLCYEAFERMAFFGIASNLVTYLTTQLREDTVSSVKNVNNWSGSVWLTPIFGAYVADTYFGRFWTFTASAVVYIRVRNTKSPAKDLIHVPTAAIKNRKLALPSDPSELHEFGPLHYNTGKRQVLHTPTF